MTHARMLTAAAGLLALAGCNSQNPSVITHDDRPIIIDGDFSDWPEGTSALADDEHVYLRFRIDEADTLQAGHDSYTISADPTSDSTPPNSGQNSGLDITFSPPTNGAPGSGVAISAGGESPRATGIDLLFAPTHASDEFEVRFSKEHLNGASTIDALGESVEIRRFFPAAQPEECLPPKPTDAIRVVSINVRFASPMGNPKPFARMIRALDPDILLLQEWQDRDGSLTPADIDEWFATHATQCPDWDVLVSDGWGVTIASCHPMSRFGPERLSRPSNAPADTHIPDPAVRFTGAVVATPVGDVLAASIHLKCCGSAGSSEDVARMAEAQAINDMLLGEFGDWSPPLRIIAGDFNLVGSRPPLDVLRNSLDTDGSDLAVAPTPVLNDGNLYTWYDPTSRFGPGRLDYVLYSDASADLLNAFALDTQHLSHACIHASGLRRDDSRATDHLVLVTDIRPKVVTKR